MILKTLDCSFVFDSLTELSPGIIQNNPSPKCVCRCIGFHLKDLPLPSVQIKYMLCYLPANTLSPVLPHNKKLRDGKIISFRCIDEPDKNKTYILFILLYDIRKSGFIIPIFFQIRINTK